YQDGKWTTYTPGHSGLPSEIDPDGNFAGWNGIALDAHGTARIMTDDGAFVLVGNSWQAPADESDEPGQPVLGILDGRGRSWVWNDSEVSVLEKTGWITLTPENSGLTAEGIYALKVDASGRVWIANNEGVNVFDGGEIQTIPADLIDQRQKILESRESRRGYNWFLPSVLALLWAAAYLNMNLLSPAVVLFVLGVPLTWLFGPAIGESFGYSRYINPGVVFTYGGLLGGIMGTMIDNALGTPGRFAWAKLLPIIFAVPAGAIAFLWLVVVSTP
ncbi:MAG: hypothetical protein ACM3QS_16290, partial [Bacteroidota bacterium]